MHTISPPTTTTRKPGPRPGVRYPYDKLEARFLGMDSHMRHVTGNIGYTGVMPSYMAKLCRVNVGVVHRWKREGLTAWAADRAAIAIGLHPINVWPEWAQGGVPTCHE